MALKIISPEMIFEVILGLVSWNMFDLVFAFLTLLDGIHECIPWYVFNFLRYKIIIFHLTIDFPEESNNYLVTISSESVDGD